MMKLVLICFAASLTVSSALLQKVNVQEEGAAPVDDHGTSSLLQEQKGQLLREPGELTARDSGDEVQRNRVRKTHWKRNQRRSRAEAKTKANKGFDKRGKITRTMNSRSDFDSATNDSPRAGSMENRRPCNDCGVAQINVKRIVGGEKAEKKEYPWMLSIIMMREGFSLSCGASLISPSWALTAAHCVQGFVASQVSVAYGIYKFSDSLKDPIKADRIEYHPDYDSTTLDKDIALIHMETSVPLSDKVHPVCIAKSPPKKGETAVVTGWGTLSYGGSYPLVLHEVAVNILKNKRCEKKYSSKDISITAAMICAAKRKKDSCTGDSGGPLVVETSKDIWEQVGIVSFGIGCAEKNFPGVYTRVDYFADWIFSHVNECE